MTLRIHDNTAKIKKGITQHCGGNPFSEGTDLRNLVSCMVVPDTAKEDILLRDEKGAAKFDEFVTERLLTNSAEKSVWDTMKKSKLKTFATCQLKTKCKVGNKLVNLREDRQLLARFLVIQQSRPSLMASLGDTIAEYEFSVIPRSLFSSDGLLLLPTDKSFFIHLIEHYPSEHTETMDQDIDVLPTREKVCIIDAMAVVQGIKKGPNMVTCSDFAAAFVQRIKKTIEPYHEGRVLFDRYIVGSLKSQTRCKRAGGTDPVKFVISDATNIKMVPLKTLLSHTETKSQLTEYLWQALLRAFAASPKKLVVVYGTTTQSNQADVFNPDMTVHSHEEADTLIPLYVIDASTQGGRTRDIDVVSPDTDVLILLIDMYSRRELPGELCFVTGKGAEKRTINIRERCFAIGNENSKGLLGIHSSSGADWGGKFVGISKKRWLSSYLGLGKNSPAIYVFKKFGEGALDLDSTLEGLECFICLVYSKTTKCEKIEDLRWELFRTKNLEGEKLPPTIGALTPHLMRVNYIVTVSRGYRHPRPVIPPIIGNGWEESVVPVKCLELPAPAAVIELVKCGCKGQCARQCSCFKNSLSCTASVPIVTTQTTTPLAVRMLNILKYDFL